MAKIIYKEGCEGQNRLESIEGIEIDLLNARKALIYPKLANAELVNYYDIEKWSAKEVNEVKALKLEDSNWATGALLRIGSPAAKHVSQFGSDRHGIFALPTLLAALEIIDQEREIDTLAETIEGADLLKDFSAFVWSCSRCGSVSGWIASGYGGFAGSNYLYTRYLAVPTILYRETK